MSESSYNAEKKSSLELHIASGTVASPNHPTWNEDRVDTDADKGVSLVFDGMGGHEGGEKAAEHARQIIKNAIPHDIEGRNIEATANTLGLAVLKAHDEIYDLNQGKVSEERMGTTVNALVLVEQEGRDPLMLIVNIGDSKTVLFEEGTIQQVSLDDGPIIGFTEVEVFEHIDTNESYEHLFRELVQTYPHLDEKLLVKEIEARSWSYLQREEITRLKLPLEKTKALADLLAVKVELLARQTQSRLDNVVSDQDLTGIYDRMIFKDRNRISKALGLERDVIPRVDGVKVHPGQIFIQGSDGFFDNMPLFEVEKILNEGLEAGEPLEQIQTTLLDRAYSLSRIQKDEYIRAKKDDITLVLIEIIDKTNQKKIAPKQAQPKNIEKKSEVSFNDINLESIHTLTQAYDALDIVESRIKDSREIWSGEGYSYTSSEILSFIDNILFYAKSPNASIKDSSTGEQIRIYPRNIPSKNNLRNVITKIADVIYAESVRNSLRGRK